MEMTGLIALVTSIMTLIGQIVKNRSQDAVVEGMQRQLGDVQSKVAECEAERGLLIRILGGEVDNQRQGSTEP